MKPAPSCLVPQHRLFTRQLGASSLRLTPAKLASSHKALSLLLAVGLSLAAGCGGDEPQLPGVRALHVLPGGSSDTDSTDFFALPFPSDLRLLPSTPSPTQPGPPTAAELQKGYDLTRFRRTRGQPAKYVELLHGQIAGAGMNAAIYFRFAGPLNPASLPATAADTLREGATAYVVDVTPGSPTFGQRSPMLVKFHAEGNRFIDDNWLSLQAVPGLPLRQKTTYAAILTSGLKALTGGGLAPDPDLARLLAAESPTAEPYKTAWLRYAPLRSYLLQHREEVGAATVFTTQDATSIMTRLREATYQQPPPTPQNLTYLRSHDGLTDVYTGTFAAPNFQQGDPPYWSEGGALSLDAGGRPQLVRTEQLRFAVAAPTTPMPAEGWPVILYAHGTGGDYLTFMRESLDLRAALIESGTAGQPPVRMAMIGIDQVLHGPRDPSGNNPELTFFNLQNLPAARDNVKQGAADDFQLLRLVENFAVEKAPQTGRPLRFDKRRIYFLGHSQGGLTGPLFLAAEPKVSAGVLSGAGAVLILSLLNKTAPNDIAALVESLLQETPLPEHPLLNLLQAYFESADPANYGPLLFREPPAGVPPKSIFQTLGLTDHYTPVPNIAAFALSLGVQPLEPRLYDLPGLELTPLRWGAGPIMGNVAAGKATGGVREYIAPPDDDGHFVIFDLWAARNAWTRFLASHTRTGVAILE